LSGRVDLHLHTTCSDGIHSPAGVVALAHAAGVAVLAITDHDTMAGVAEAQRAALELGVRVIPGVEVSVEFDRQDIHVLAYFPDSTNGGLQTLLCDLRRARQRRLDRMLGRLRQLGLPLRRSDVMAQAPPSGPVGRPHLAQALVARGWVENYNDAFRYYLASEAPAYLPNHTPEPEEVLSVLRQAGGIPVLAHPSCYQGRAVLDRFLSAGIMGLEVYHPRNDPAEVEFLKKEAERRGLLITGGSDYHGNGRGDTAPGSVGLGVEHLARLDEARAQLQGH
jgi:3',5'-nucleoside bisphosphate phosphatase